MIECEICGDSMSQGYEFKNEYYCSDECLNTKINPKEKEILQSKNPDYFKWNQLDDNYFCPDLDEYGDIDTGRDPRGDYLDTDFT